MEERVKAVDCLVQVVSNISLNVHLTLGLINDQSRYAECYWDPCFPSIQDYADPHSSVGAEHNLRTGGRWFDTPTWLTFFPRIDDGHSSLTAVLFFHNSYVEKQSEAWEEYRAKY